MKFFYIVFKYKHLILAELLILVTLENLEIYFYYKRMFSQFYIKRFMDKAMLL